MNRLKKQLKEDLAAATVDPEAHELYVDLVNKLYALHPRERQFAYWVMDKPSFDDIKAKFPPYVGADPYVVLGKRVVIQPDGGAAHLVVEPQPEMTPIEVGQEVIYLQCIDPNCPDCKPGTHHAHLQKP